MIDKFFYKIFGFLDNMLAKVDEVFTFNFPNSKKTKNVKSPDKRMNFPIEQMRDNKILESFKKRIEKELKEKDIFKNLRKEVDTGANGTQKYVIKKGINKGKVV